MADFLFVQNANHVTYADGKLTLVGVNPATCLAVRSHLLTNFGILFARW